MDRLVRLRERRLHAVQTLTRVGQLIIPPSRSKSPSARYQSLNMSLLTSLHSIIDCMTYVYWRSWLCDSRAPPIPIVIPSENPGSGVFGVKVPLEKVNHAVHGVAVESRVPLLSEME